MIPVAAITVQRYGVSSGGGAAVALRPLPSRTTQSHGYTRRLRYQPVRGLHVLVDGRSAKSCTMFAVQADGADITTIEGLARNGDLHPVQEGFWERHGLQCGYCTPGMIVAAAQLLERNANPSREEIRPVSKGTCAAAQATSTSSTRFNAQRARGEMVATDPVLPKLVGQRIKRRRIRA